MQSLYENKPLRYALMCAAAGVIYLAAEIDPSFNSSFELVPFPPTVTLVIFYSDRTLVFNNYVVRDSSRFYGVMDTRAIVLVFVQHTRDCALNKAIQRPSLTTDKSC